MISTSRRILLGCTLLSGLIANAPVLAQQNGSFTKPISIIVPYGAGGGTDFLARTVAPFMSEKLGQPVIVENKPGAGTAIAAADVARAAPDGHRLLIGDLSTFSTNPFLYKKLSYDPTRDFTPITLTSRTPYVLVVNPMVHPQRKLEDFVTAIRNAPPETVNYGSAGNGGPAHLTAVMFERAAGVRMTHIAYKGAGPAMPDLLSGQIGMLFTTYASVRSHLESGKLRVLGMGGSKPQTELPNIPTIGSVLPGFESVFWTGLVAPKGTPLPLLYKLREAYAAAVNDPVIRKKLLDSGIDPLLTTGSDMSAYMRSESDRMGKIIKEAKIELD